MLPRSSRPFSAALAAAVLIFIASPRAQAVVIAHENFEGYAVNDPLNGRTSGLGWTAPWSANAAVTIQSIDLGQGGETKAARLQGTAGDITSMVARNFTATTENTVYMAMYTRVESFDDDDFFNLQLTGGLSGNVANSGGIGYRNVPGNPLFARSGTSNAPGVSTSSAIGGTDNTNFLLVAKMTKAGNGEYEIVDLFVNPVGGVEPGVSDANATSTEPGHTSINRFNVRIRDLTSEAADVKYIDQLRVATTFQEAVTGLSAPKATSATLSAFADAHILNGSNINVNTGGNATLDVKYAETEANNNHRKAYIQYDLSSVDLDAIDKAALQLTVAASPAGVDPTPQAWTFGLFGLRDDFVPPAGKLDEGWLESALTGNNAPGNSTTTGGVNLADMFGGAPLETFVLQGAGVAGEVITLDSAGILDFLKSDTDGVATFILLRLTQGTLTDTLVHAFLSSESTIGQGPTLILESIPEPSTLLLGSLMAAGLGLRRRRAA